MNSILVMKWNHTFTEPPWLVIQPMQLYKAICNPSSAGWSNACPNPHTCLPTCVQMQVRGVVRPPVVDHSRCLLAADILYCSQYDIVKLNMTTTVTYQQAAQASPNQDTTTALAATTIITTTVMKAPHASCAATS